MNIGINASQGEYIGIVEPDDFVPLNMYEDLYLEAVADNLDFIKADFFRFTTNMNGDMHLIYNRLDNSKQYYNVLLNPSEMPEVTYFVINTWSGIYKRSFLQQHSICHNETPGASFQDNGFYWLTTVYAQRAKFIDRPYYMNRRDNPNSSVKSKDKVYCMNEEYKYIRSILEPQKEIWERFKYTYTLRKFHNYLFTLERISDPLKKDYVEAIYKDLEQSNTKKEIEATCYTPYEWEKLQFLLNDPEGFYYKYGLCSDMRLKSELEWIKNSTTFKVGKFVMYIPCAIKRHLIKRKKLK